MVTAFTPAGLHHVFCTKASGAEPSYVTKFRCHYQMELQGQLPERKILYATSSPTHLPKPLLFATVLTKRPEHPRGGHRLKVRPSAESNCKFSNCAHRKGIIAFDLLMLHPSEFSWAIVFHKGQNVDSTVPAKCKLENLHIAFLGLTQASRWKWFPKVTAKLGTKVSCMEDIWHEGANEVVPRVRTSVPFLVLDLGRLNLPLRTFLQSWDNPKNLCLSSPQRPSHHPHPNFHSYFLGVVKEDICLFSLLMPRFHFLK